jgi:hypothetical protein
MILQEVFEKAEDGYYDPEDDNSQLKMSDLRKTRLTLLQLNKLRKMDDVRAYEQAEKVKNVQLQYVPKADAAAGALPGM